MQAGTTASAAANKGPDGSRNEEHPPPPPPEFPADITPQEWVRKMNEAMTRHCSEDNETRRNDATNTEELDVIRRSIALKELEFEAARKRHIEETKALALPGMLNIRASFERLE
jgi:hypothetical protein